jgi:hypothetical protein
MEKKKSHAQNLLKKPWISTLIVIRFLLKESSPVEFLTFTMDYLFLIRAKAYETATFPHLFTCDF